MVGRRYTMNAFYLAAQELNLQRHRGASIKGKSMGLFLRMNQTTIPQENLQLIKSDLVARLDSSREIKGVGIREEKAKT